MPRQWLLLCLFAFILGCSPGDQAAAPDESTDNAAPSASQADPMASAKPAPDTASPGNTVASNEPESTTPSDPSTEVTEPEPSVDELLQRANNQAQFGNLAGAITTIDSVLEKEPEHIQALAMYSAATQQHGMALAQQDRMSGNELMLKSAAAMRKLKELNQIPPQLATMYSTAIYNEACCLSLMGKTDEAIASLKEALDADFPELELLATDTDLDNLRENETFKQLVAEATASGAERMLAKTKEQLAAFESFPFSFELPNLADETVALSSLKDKVVIVDVWGTWCPPCRAEVPHFVKLYDTYKEQGLEIVGINYERVPEDQIKPTIQKFIDEEGVNYACVIGDDTTRSQIPNFEGFPTTLFIDRKGTVRLKLVGYSEYDELEAIVTMLLEESVE